MKNRMGRLPAFGLVAAVALGAHADWNREKFMISSGCVKTNLVSAALVADMKAAGLDHFHGITGLSSEGYRLFSEGGVPCMCFPITRISGVGWGEQFWKDYFWNFDRSVDRFRDRFGDCPASFCVDIGDEPSALVLPQMRKIALRTYEAFPGKLVYLNLFPCYARLATDGADSAKSQLGTKTFAEYVDTYCRQMPLDYISTDFYLYSSGVTNNAALLRCYYLSNRDFGDACARTGRSYWFYAQANSLKTYLPAKPTSERMMQWQALSAMAYGAESIAWACWSDYGWWTNNVLTVTGEKTEQYEKVKNVNRRLHCIGGPYMQFRRTATHLVAHDGPAAARLKGLGLTSERCVDTGFFRGVRTTDDAPLLVGEMAPRDAAKPCRAIFVFAADDPWDMNPVTKTVEFRAVGTVKGWGLDGEMPVERSDDGLCRVTIGSNEAVLLMVRTDPSAHEPTGAAKVEDDKALALALQTSTNDFLSVRLTDKDVEGQYGEFLRSHAVIRKLGFLQRAADACRDSGRGLLMEKAFVTTNDPARVSRPMLLLGMSFGDESGFRRADASVARSLLDEYARFRRVNTHFVGFTADGRFEKLMKCTFAEAAGLKPKDRVDTGWFMGVRAEDGRPLLVAELVPRKSFAEEKAVFVFAACDPWMPRFEHRRILFKSAGKIRAIGADGPLRLIRAEDGDYNLVLRPGEGALVVMDKILDR